MIPGKLEHRLGQGNRTAIQVESQQSKDALRNTVNIDRVHPVVKISDSAVLTEEMTAVKFESVPDAQIKFCRLQAPAYGLQCAQIVAGVEVVNPIL